MGESNALSTFTFAPGLNLRALDINGEPWFILKDVCAPLGLEAKHAQAKVGRDDIRLALQSEHPGCGFPNRGLLIINEPGLYALIMRSDKPEAKAFQRWVTAEVLPSLRKHGIAMTTKVAASVATGLL